MSALWLSCVSHGTTVGRLYLPIPNTDFISISHISFEDLKYIVCLMESKKIPTESETRKKATIHLMKALLSNSLSDLVAFIDIVQKEASIQK